MKIAQIAPLMESVPPRLYGGTERIVSYLTDELVRLGHEVTLFASADSVTAAKLVSCASMALRLDSNVRDPIPYYMLMLDRVRKLADEFDVLHFQHCLSIAAQAAIHIGTRDGGADAATGIGRKSNGQCLNRDRAHRAAENGCSNLISFGGVHDRHSFWRWNLL
jgi:hypothetical protein